MISIRQVRRLIAVAVFLSASAGAYTRETTAAGTPLHRRDASHIRVLVNNSVSPGATNSDGDVVITPLSDPLRAVAAATEEWNGASSSTAKFAPPQPTTLSNDPADGRVVVTIEDTPENRSVTGSFLAVTLWQYSADGTVTDSDVILNPHLVQDGRLIAFSTDHSQDTYDLQGLVAHELGHVLGAGHSSVVGAIMFPSMARFSRFNSDAECTLRRRLSDDDIAFLTDAYPAPSAVRQFGSIAGKVSFFGGSPVPGALIGAVNPAAGVVIGTVSSLQDGSFAIHGVPPGTYFVYAHPADGPVTAADIALPDMAYANTTFRATFAGGNAAPASITVSAGRSSRADIAVDPRPGQMQIAFLGTGSVGGSDWTYSPGPKAVPSSQRHDIYLYGKGLDAGIAAGEVRLIGPGVSLSPLSAQADPAAAAQGYVPIRFTMESTPLTSPGLATIAVVDGTDAAIYSGGLVLLNPSLPERCSYLLSAKSALFERGASQRSIAVTTESGCFWNAVSNVPWVTIASSADGSGDGTVVLSVDANASPFARAGSITIAGQTFAIQQKGWQRFFSIGRLINRATF